MADGLVPLFAEYAEIDALVGAIEALRTDGYDDLEAYTPYPVHEVEQALRLRKSRLPLAIFIGGMTGAAAAYFLQWLLVAHFYPLDVGGRPPHMPLAFVIITFEMGVLCASFTAFFGLLFKARLLRLWDPLFEVEGIERASVDRYWLRLGAAEVARDPRGAARALRQTRPVMIISLPPGGYR